MFSRPVRLGLILWSASLGAYALQRHGPVGAVLLAGTACLVYGHFRYGTEWLAHRNLKRGNSQRASRLFAQIRAPHLLNSQNRAYYEWIRGELACEADDFAAAESHLRQSLAHHLRTSNDRCAAEARLAAVLIQQNMTEEARELIRTARRRQHKSQLDTILNDLQNAAGA